MKPEDEWAERIRESLPSMPPANVEEYEDVNEDIGPALIIYKRESRTPADWEAYEILGIENEIKYHWTASCICTECGEQFFAPWGKESFYVLIGEDNETYVNFFSDEEEMTTEIKNGDHLFCPACGAECVAVPVSSIGRGRTFRSQVASLETVDGATAIVYWTVSRYLEKTGYTGKEITPREAIVISPSGKLLRFSHVNRYGFSGGNETARSTWERRKQVTEPELLQYKSEGMWKVGCYCVPFAGTVEGTTGEKSGIDDYWGGDYPTAYLKLWKKHRNVENIVRSGADGLISDAIRTVTKTYYGNKSVDYEALDKVFRWKEKKPNRMLGVSKQDYRRICGNGWTMEMLETYQQYLKFFPDTEAGTFEGYIDELSLNRLKRIRGIWDEGLDKIIRYLEKQAAKEGSERVDIQFQLFEDYRNMIAERNLIAELGELTQAEKYPPVLRRAHDRISRERNEWMREENIQRRTSRNAGDVAIYGEKFSELYQNYKALEYSDGEICIVVPHSPVDLIREGHILNHCVGGYSQKHCSGMPIFFVRHARRPERSWYTLNEDLTGKEASRIQLHGYGNEYAHGKSLTIPKKVLDFVDKWEREVLAPWFQNQKKKGKSTAA